MRLFVALDLDAAARSAIAEIQSWLRGAAAASPIRWVRPDQLHLTLVFLGEVADARVPALVTAIERPVAQAPFDLVFSGLGAFPPRGAPRALWVGASGGEAALRALHHEIADRVARCDLPLEVRPFSPHLTIGRWKQSRPSDRGRLLGAGADALHARVRIDHATLYHSRLSSEGPAYTAVARANLAGV
jgi:2'-5' RNA ligase